MPLRIEKTSGNAISTALAVLVGLTAVGGTGFYLLGHGERSLFDSFWMTLQILTTVGDTGMQRTQPDRIWSFMLMVVGVMAVFYLGINVVRFILDGELREILGRRQLQSRINKLDDHFVICGFGRMGRSLAEALHKRGAPFVVIDRSEEAITEADHLDYLYIEGDSMSDEILEAARIDLARGIATCLPEDADNVFVTLTARALAPRLTIVAKANYEDTHAKLVRAGANHVLSPNKLAADRAMTKFMLPAVDDLIEFVVHGKDLEVSKVSLEHFPGAVGKALHELSLPTRASVIVVAVVDEDGRRTFNPPPDTRLQHGDELIVIGAAGAMERMVELFGEKEPA